MKMIGDQFDGCWGGRSGGFNEDVAPSHPVGQRFSTFWLISLTSVHTENSGVGESRETR